MSDDLKVNPDSPTSPISLDKFLKLTATERKELTVLIDGTGFGIKKDSLEPLYITPDECRTQALYYLNNKFKDGKAPLYLIRYLDFMFFDAPFISEDEVNTNPNSYIETGKKIVDFLENAKDNDEALQVIGLVQLIAGSLNMARKAGAGILLYIDKPETHLHPKRQSRFMTMFQHIRKEYGYEPTT